MPMSLNNESLAPAAEAIKKIISLAATCIGLAVILIGLKFAMDIFQLIFTILQSPASLTEPMKQMAAIIGGSAFGEKLEGGAVFLVNIMALAVYCGGALVCAWLTLALMHTGAKIVALNAGDQNAVKALLKNVFGTRPLPKTETTAATSATTTAKTAEGGAKTRGRPRTQT